MKTLLAWRDEIAAWQLSQFPQLKTFGSKTLNAMLWRTRMEVEELLGLILDPRVDPSAEPDKVRGELADIAIMLMDIATIGKFDPTPSALGDDDAFPPATWPVTTYAAFLNRQLSELIWENTDIPGNPFPYTTGRRVRLLFSALEHLAVCYTTTLSREIGIKMLVNVKRRWSIGSLGIAHHEA